MASMADPGEADRLRYLALALAEGGHGTPCPVLLAPELEPEQALSWSLEDAARRGVRPAAARRLLARDLAATARRVADQARTHGLQVVAPSDPG